MFFVLLHCSPEITGLRKIAGLSAGVPLRINKERGISTPYSSFPWVESFVSPRKAVCFSPWHYVFLDFWIPLALIESFVLYSVRENVIYKIHSQNKH